MKCPIFSSIVTVSLNPFGCCPKPTRRSNNSSTLVRLKFPGKGEVTRPPVIQTHYGMSEFQAVTPESPVTQMTKINFSNKRQVIFCPNRVVIRLRVKFGSIVKLPVYIAEDVFNGIRINRTVTVNILFSGRHVDPYAYCPCAVLSLCYAVSPSADTAYSRHNCHVPYFN